MQTDFCITRSSLDLTLHKVPDDLPGGTGARELTAMAMTLSSKAGVSLATARMAVARIASET